MKWIDNKIGDSGAKMISEGLKSNSTLTELNLVSDEKRRNNVIEWSMKKQFRVKHEQTTTSVTKPEKN